LHYYFQVRIDRNSPPWSATLTWWWGFAPMTRKISKIWRWGATKSWPNPWEQICCTLPVLLCWSRLHSRLRLYSRLFTASQPSTALQLFPVTCGYIRGCALGRADTASALGRCKTLSTPEVKVKKIDRSLKILPHV